MPGWVAWVAVATGFGSAICWGVAALIPVGNKAIAEMRINEDFSFLTGPLRKQSVWNAVAAALAAITAVLQALVLRYPVPPTPPV